MKILCCTLPLVYYQQCSINNNLMKQLMKVYCTAFTFFEKIKYKDVSILPCTLSLITHTTILSNIIIVLSAKCMQIMFGISRKILSQRNRSRPF